MNSIDVYDTKMDSEIHPEETCSAKKIKFYFESVGAQKVIKAIEYSCLEFKFLGRSIYNLGFGDYDPITGNISDVAVSNNGDVYKVFNTVLHTVFAFFDRIPDGVIFVQGSDSDPDFFQKCITTCRKRCIHGCKNGDRRISIYRKYINKNYLFLYDKYIFMGGLVENADEVGVEDYMVGKPYNAILVYKRI